MRLKVTRILLMGLTILISIGAFFGGIMMLIKPDGSLLGMTDMLPYFHPLPFSDTLFQDYTFAGIMLIIVNGITNLIAFLFLCFRKKAGHVLGTLFGVTLMAWISIQFSIFPINAMDIIFFLLGLLQFIVGYISLVSYCQEHFHVLPSDYPNIQKDSETMVVYFSRKGYTKKLAYQLADEHRACIEELHTAERTEGDLGYWWSGRFAMHRWRMKTEKVIIPQSVKKVILVTPIWVFHMSAPMWDFIMENQEVLKTKGVAILFNHFNNALPSCARKEVESLLPVTEIYSVTTILGYQTKRKTVKVTK